MKQQKMIVVATLLSGLLALLLGVSPVQSAPEQQANLLNNGSFEGGSYMYNNDGDMKFVPNAWTPWWNTVSNTDCNNALVKPHFEMEAHPTHVKDGMWSARYWTDQKIDAGMYQTVGATPGMKYKFSIHGFSWVSNNGQVDDQSDGEQSMRVGIDPTGGTNANAASVVWAPEVFNNDRFVLLTVEAAATADKVTVFTRTKPNWCMTRNDSFWDAATLTASGQAAASTSAPAPAGKTAVPTQPSSWGAQAGTIITVTPQPDGSIVHTVGSGETCTGIAVAYNVSLDDLYSLNSLSNDKCRFVYPGQTLIIRPAQQPTPAPPTPTPDSVAMAETPSEVVAPPAQTNGKICVTGYEDKNGNGLPEAADPKLAGMTFEVNNGTQVIGTYTTDDQNPSYCFAELPPGSYTISWTGEGLSPTTAQSLSVTLASGGTETKSFGAQSGSGENEDSGSISGPEQGGGLPTWAMALLLGIGVMLLLSGVGVAGYFVLMRRAKI